MRRRAAGARGSAGTMVLRTRALTDLPVSPMGGPGPLPLSSLLSMVSFFGPLLRPVHKYFLSWCPLCARDTAKDNYYYYNIILFMSAGHDGEQHHGAVPLPPLTVASPHARSRARPPSCTCSASWGRDASMIMHNYNRSHQFALESCGSQSYAVSYRKSVSCRALHARAAALARRVDIV